MPFNFGNDRYSRIRRRNQDYEESIARQTRYIPSTHGEANQHGKPPKKKRVVMMGGALTDYAKYTESEVPRIVTVLIEEIEDRGLETECSGYSHNLEIEFDNPDCLIFDLVDMALKAWDGGDAADFTSIPPSFLKYNLYVLRDWVCDKDIQGLYHSEGNAKEMDLIISCFEVDPSNAIIVDSCSVHSLCNVLKRYLRKLPEPLLSFATYAGFIKLAKESQLEKCPESVIQTRLKKLLARQPKVHASTISAMIRHLKHIEEQTEDNNIEMDSLISMFVLSFIRPPVEESVTSADDCEQHLAAQTEAVKLLLQYNDISENIEMEDWRKISSKNRRFFRIPFVYRDDAYNVYSSDGVKRRGLYYAEFQHSQIWRQMELHPGCAPLLLKRGRHDDKMCKPELELTRLVEIDGAEITKESFKKAWRKYGGKM